MSRAQKRRAEKSPHSNVYAKKYGSMHKLKKAFMDSGEGKFFTRHTGHWSATLRRIELGHWIQMVRFANRVKHQPRVRLANWVKGDIRDFNLWCSRHRLGNLIIHLKGEV